jgi:outer membrane protein assembly factor BamB
MRKASGRIKGASVPRKPDLVDRERSHRVAAGAVLAAATVLVLATAVASVPKEHSPLPGIARYAMVVYVDGKDMIEYAIDLMTGAQIWQFNLGADSGIVANCQSTAALVANRVVVPEGPYLFALDAVTGAKIWRTAAAAASYLSSPGVAGALRDQVAFEGDLSGVEHGFRITDGAEVFSFTTAAGGISSSAAEAAGRVLFGASDGNLYALG